MTISFVSIGAVADGSTPLSAAYPASIAAGNLLILLVASKPGTAVPTAAGWTQEQQYIGGIGSDSSSDSGTVVSTIFSKVAVGDETGTLTITCSGTTSVTQAVMLQYAGASGATFDLASTFGKQDNPVSQWRDFPDDVPPKYDRVVMGTDPGFTVNDVIISFAGVNSNNGISPFFTTDPLVTPGVTTWASVIQRVQLVTGTGRDQAIGIAEHLVVGGTSSGVTRFGANNHYGQTYSASPTGPVILLRIREAAAPVAPTVGTHPDAKAVVEGNTANFTAVINGATSYQWKRKPGGSGTAVNVVGGSGATTQSYVTGVTTVTGGNHNNGDTYGLTGTNTEGSVTTNFAPLSVTAAGGDSTAPTAPGQPAVSGQTKTGYTMTFTASTDAVGVTGYEYQINSEAVVNTGSPALSIVVTSRVPGATDSFRVRGYDAAGNRSPFSTARVVTNPIYGFDFHNLSQYRFVSFVGSLTDLSLQVGTGVIVRANDDNDGTVIAASSTLTTDANGRLSRWTHTALNLGTTYEVVFKRTANGDREIKRIVAT